MDEPEIKTSKRKYTKKKKLEVNFEDLAYTNNLKFKYKGYVVSYEHYSKIFKKTFDTPESFESLKEIYNSSEFSTHINTQESEFTKFFIDNYDKIESLSISDLTSNIITNDINFSKILYDLFTPQQVFDFFCTSSHSIILSSLSIKTKEEPNGNFNYENYNIICVPGEVLHGSIKLNPFRGVYNRMFLFNISSSNLDGTFKQKTFKLKNFNDVYEDTFDELCFYKMPDKINEYYTMKALKNAFSFLNEEKYSEFHFFEDDTVFLKERSVSELEEFIENLKLSVNGGTSYSYQVQHMLEFFKCFKTGILIP